MPKVRGEDYRLERRLIRFVAECGVVRVGERPLLMLSGGADSMALLHLLQAADRRLGLGLRCAALHVDYRARGADSDRDRELVAQACEQLQVPLDVVRLQRRLEGAGFQARARALRYEQARQLCAARGCDVIVTGHNRDDQAETMLYRLSKYVSPRGLSGMRPREGMLARPLLCLGAGEIRDWCAARGIAYGEDVTNSEPRYARNLIRLEVLPALARLNPRVVETLAATAELAAAEQAVLAQATAAALSRVRRGDARGLPQLDVAALRAEDPALRALALHAWLRDALGGEALVERRVVAALEALTARLSEDGSVHVGRGLTARRSGGRLILETVASAAHACSSAQLDGAALQQPGAVELPHCGRRWRLRLTAGPALPVDADGGISLGLPQPPIRIVLRHPRCGERFTPCGLGAETTVARYLAAARVPRELRPLALVLEVDGVVAWIGSVLPGGRLRGRVADAFLVHESTAWTLQADQEVA